MIEAKLVNGANALYVTYPTVKKHISTSDGLPPVSISVTGEIDKEDPKDVEKWINNYVTMFQIAHDDVKVNIKGDYKEQKTVDKTPIMRFFAYDHLPEQLQEISAPICDLAIKLDLELPNSPEKSAGLRKLLEAKDCFVRASFDK